VAGRAAEAADAYRRTIELNPASSVAQSGLIFALDLMEDPAVEAHGARQRWNERFGQVWRDRPAGHPNDRDPARPLRVGYVSADFYLHSAASAFMPVLRSHDHSQVTVYCYSGAPT